MLDGMSQDPQSDGGTEPLPESVTLLEVGEKTIFLVGTAHVSRRSVEDVRVTIEQVRPEAVCVELCRPRYENMTDSERWKKTDIVKIIREKKAPLLLASLIMTSFQRRIGKLLGVTPGEEMMEGIRLANETGAELVLADRDIQVTLRRTWGHLGFWDKFRMLYQLIGSVFVSEEIDEKTIEELKDKERLADVLELIAGEFPRLKASLIDERDLFLAQKIREAPGRKVVAVVGAGHVPGIVQAIGQDRSLEPLLELPPPAVLPTILKWAVPVLIVGLIVAGFFRGGAEESLGSIYIWVMVNGILAALGAALALGHPLTVISAFLAAPLTSLNPMVAAGWVSGLVQALIKKPTVKDLEDLPEAITSVRGFWMNPASRILLVVVLSNLGSSLGTLISGSWIAARTIG